jgi:hypothetical protein
MQADVQQLVTLKDLLAKFSEASGLRVNYSKSNLIRINIAEDNVDLFNNALVCQRGTLPFTYLGLPLSTTKPRKEFFMPLILSAQRRLSACSMYLSYGDKLRLVNSVLSSLPTFYLATLKVYKWVLSEFDKYRRHCLWRTKDLEDKKPPLAAWDLVCRPKDQGGLGVINLAAQNDCLLMKHLHKFYNKANLPWVKLVWESYYANALPPARTRDVSFWWRDCLKSSSAFKVMVTCQVNCGDSVLLWKDSWLNNSLQWQLPRLFSFAKNEDSTFASLSLCQDLDDFGDHFHLPLLEEVFEGNMP